MDVDVGNMEPGTASPKRLLLVFRAVIKYLHPRKHLQLPAIQGTGTRGWKTEEEIDTSLRSTAQSY